MRDLGLKERREASKQESPKGRMIEVLRKNVKTRRNLKLHHRHRGITLFSLREPFWWQKLCHKGHFVRYSKCWRRVSRFKKSWRGFQQKEVLEVEYFYNILKPTGRPKVVPAMSWKPKSQCMQHMKISEQFAPTTKEKCRVTRVETRTQLKPAPPISSHDVKNLRMFSEVGQPATAPCWPNMLFTRPEGHTKCRSHRQTTRDWGGKVGGDM